MKVKRVGTRGQFGGLPFIAGTLMTSLMEPDGPAIAVPISLAIAILLSEYALPAIRDPLVFVVELLAAIPSVVLGLWGILVLAPLLAHGRTGILSAAILGLGRALGEMMWAAMTIGNRAVR